MGESFCTAFCVCVCTFGIQTHSSSIWTKRKLRINMQIKIVRSRGVSINHRLVVNRAAAQERRAICDWYFEKAGWIHTSKVCSVMRNTIAKLRTHTHVFCPAVSSDGARHNIIRCLPNDRWTMRRPQKAEQWVAALGVDHIPKRSHLTSATVNNILQHLYTVHNQIESCSDRSGNYTIFAMKWRSRFLHGRSRADRSPPDY